MNEFSPGRLVAQRMSRAWPSLLLMLLTLLFLGDLFFAGKTLAMRDTFCDFLPWRLFTSQAFRSGAVPWWNPYGGIGKPFVADPQTAVFYPPHILFYFLPAAWALKLSWALHLWIAGSSLFALARHWRLEVVPALITAVAFMFSTWLAAYMEFFSAFTAAVWGPLILLLVSRIMKHWSARGGTTSWLSHLIAGLRQVAWLAIVLAVQYLAGHPEVVIQTMLITGLYVLVCNLYLRHWAAFAGTTAAVLLAGLIALGLTLPQFLLSWELVQNSERAQGIDPGLDVASLHPRQLLSLFFPFLFGRPGYPDKYWAQTIFEFWAGTCYVGLLPLVLGGFALVGFCLRSGESQKQRRPLTVFAAVLVLFGLLMASGRYLGLYGLLSSHVPGFGLIRWPSKYLLAVAYGLALMGGLGCQAILDFRGRFRTRGNFQRIAWSGGMVFLALCASYVLLRNNPAFVKWMTGAKIEISSACLQGVLPDFVIALAFFGLSFGLVLLLILRGNRGQWRDAAAILVLFANLLIVSRQIQPVMSDAIYQVKPEFLFHSLRKPEFSRVHSNYATAQWLLYGNQDESVFKWVRCAGVGDVWLPFGIYQTSQSGMRLARYQTLASLVSTAAPSVHERLADLLDIGWVVGGAPFESIFWQQASKDLALVERTNCLPRAYTVARWTELSESGEILTFLTSAGFDPRQEAIVEPTRGLAMPDSQAGSTAAVPGTAQLMKDDLDGVQLAVTTSQRSLLVLTDAWYPGWQVEVDGAHTPMLRVDYLFRGVFLEPGRHRVVFAYRPWQVRYGAWVSFVAAVVCALLLAWTPPRWLYIWTRRDLQRRPVMARLPPQCFRRRAP